jgi:hypothetical protein
MHRIAGQSGTKSGTKMAPTIQAIAEYVERSVLEFPVGVGEDKVEQDGTRSFARLLEMSDEEVEQMLLAKLKEIR